MSEILDAIRSRGYWQVLIRPAVFVRNRIEDISALFPIVRQASVQLRGWDYPHVDNDAPAIHMDWVGQETRWEHVLELWRMYQSGQFVHFSAFWEDWRDHSSFWPPEKGWEPRKRFGVGETLFRLTEIFEYAARLSLSQAGDESMHISVTLKDLGGRILVADTPGRFPLRRAYKASISEFPLSMDLARPELVGDPRSHALRGATELFKRFGWEASPEVLKTWQAELGKR